MSGAQPRQAVRAMQDRRECHCAEAGGPACSGRSCSATRARSGNGVTNVRGRGRGHSPSVHDERLPVALLLDSAEQPGSTALPAGQCGGAVAVMPDRPARPAACRGAGSRCGCSAYGRARAPAAAPCPSTTAQSPADGSAAGTTAAARRSRRAAPANSGANRRHPRRLPERFYVALPRRTAGRCRGAAMSRTQPGAARAAVPGRRGRRRQRAAQRIRRDGGSHGACSRTAAGPAARADAAAAVACRGRNPARLRRRSARVVRWRSAGRRPHHDLPCRACAGSDAGMLRRNGRSAPLMPSSPYAGAAM